MGNAAPITFRTSARSGGGGSVSRLRSGHRQGRRAVPRGASPGLGRGLCTPGRPSSPLLEAVAGPRRSEAGKRPRHAGDAARLRPPRSRRAGSTHRWLARRSARLRAARRDERDGRPLLVATPSAVAPSFATAGSQRRVGRCVLPAQTPRGAARRFRGRWGAASIRATCSRLSPRAGVTRPALGPAPRGASHRTASRREERGARRPSSRETSDAARLRRPRWSFR